MGSKIAKNRQNHYFLHDVLADILAHIFGAYEVTVKNMCGVTFAPNAPNSVTFCANNLNVFSAQQNVLSKRFFSLCNILLKKELPTLPPAF